MNNYTPSHLDRSSNKKIVAIDIDDVLADSIPNWIKFVNNNKVKYLEQKAMNTNWAGKIYNDLYDLKKMVPYYYYRLLKSKYRESETKAHLPLKEGVHQLLEYLYNNKYSNIIISKRPDFCSKLTYEWLHSKCIIYDEVILSKHKHITVLQRFPDLKFMIEDNRDICNSVAKWGYRVFLVNNKYNKGVINSLVTRVDNLTDIIDILKKEKNEKTKTNNS